MTDARVTVLGVLGVKGFLRFSSNGTHVPKVNYFPGIFPALN
jgi:hypothetical protein